MAVCGSRPCPGAWSPRNARPGGGAALGGVLPPLELGSGAARDKPQPAFPPPPQVRGLRLELGPRRGQLGSGVSRACDGLRLGRGPKLAGAGGGRKGSLVCSGRGHKQRLSGLGCPGGGGRSRASREGGNPGLAGWGAVTPSLQWAVGGALPGLLRAGRRLLACGG